MKFQTVHFISTKYTDLETISRFTYLKSRIHFDTSFLESISNEQRRITQQFSSIRGQTLLDFYDSTKILSIDIVVFPTSKREIPSIFL